MQIINSNENRNSNMECLRIFSMLLIVLEHFFVQANLYEHLSGCSLFLAYLVSSASRIGVFMFVCISAYFMYNKQFKASRILKLYAELFFYNFTLMILMCIFHVKLTLLQILKSIFPFWELSLWYISVYIIILMLLPMLNTIICCTERKILRNTLSISWLIISIMSTIYHVADTWLCHLIYFLLIFLTIWYFKKYPLNQIKIDKYFYLFSSIVLYGVLVYFKCYISNPQINNYIAYIIGEYKSIPCIFIAFGIFMFFKNLQLGTNKIINFLSKSCVAVYIIHQAPSFAPFLWRQFCNAKYIANSNHVVLYALIIAFVIYISCIIADLLRIKYIEPIFIKSVLYKKLDSTLNSLFSNSKKQTEVLNGQYKYIN